MSEGHTPGPWGIEWSDCGGAFPCDSSNSDGGWIGPLRDDGKTARIVCRVDTCTEYSEEARAQKVANASLIAAAPELLEALEYAERNYDLGVHGSEKAIAAIAKARGQ